ncbi:MAG: S41 family peptidase [Cyanobacteria bacterium P01_A01_bin.114]
MKYSEKYSENISWSFISGIAIAAAAVVSPLAVLMPGPVEAFQDSPKSVLDEAWQIVYREYVDGSFNRTDWIAIRQTLLSQDYSSRREAYRELRRALQQLNDPYTRFLDPDQYAELTEQTSGEVSGVGMQLRREDDSIVVVSVIEGSPAAQSDIRSGDRIVMVDGRSTERLSVETVSQLIRGEQGSQVTVTLERAGRSETVVLTRARLEVATVDYDVREQSDIRIGYIRLSEFSAHAAEQMQVAIEQLDTEENVEAFVLDLRNNPGGLLNASIDISRMWLPRGPIVRTVDRDGNDDEISANRTALTDLPLAVLVNGQSASSSEIVTGALRDNNRAVVVGSPTFGKALVQSLHGLSDGSGIAVTVAHYYTPNGTDISSKGISPDVYIELTRNQQQALSQNPDLLGTSADPQFVEAVGALEGGILARRQQASPAATNLHSGSTPQLGRTLALPEASPAPAP